jgi:hypothetical protein
MQDPGAYQQQMPMGPPSVDPNLSLGEDNIICLIANTIIYPSTWIPIIGAMTNPFYLKNKYSPNTPLCAVIVCIFLWVIYMMIRAVVVFFNSVTTCKNGIRNPDTGTYIPGLLFHYPMSWVFWFLAIIPKFKGSDIENVMMWFACLLVTIWSYPIVSIFWWMDCLATKGPLCFLAMLGIPV